MARQAQLGNGGSRLQAAEKEKRVPQQPRDASAVSQKQAADQAQPLGQGLTRLAALKKASPDLAPAPLNRKVLLL